jgi:type I restriction enzyme S subunit
MTKMQKHHSAPKQFDRSANMIPTWRWTTLPEIGHLSRGKSKHRPRNDPKLYGGVYPFIQTGDIRDSGGAVTAHTQTYSECGLAQSQLWPAGTLCITIAATIAETGILKYPACFPDSVVGFRYDGDPVTVRFIELYFRIAKTKLEKEAPATAQKNINVDVLSRLPIPFPPLPDQRRIVAEIEKQFTRLDAGITALRNVQAKLKRYRATVLKAACEGRLVSTEAERAKFRRAKYETAADLLIRILKIRRESSLGRTRFKEPTAPDTSKLPALPEGWSWTSIEQLGQVQLGRQRSPKNVSKNYPTKYIRAANITERGIDVADVLEMEFSPAERERFTLKDGDLVLSEASGSASQVGKPAIWRDEIPNCCFQNTVLRFRPTLWDEKYALTAFKHFYLNSIFAKVAGGVGINHLGAEKFSAIPFALPPLAEQKRIVAEVERRISVVEELEAVVSANLQRANRLRQSILQQAFSGKLFKAEQT